MKKVITTHATQVIRRVRLGILPLGSGNGLANSILEDNGAMVGWLVGVGGGCMVGWLVGCCFNCCAAV